MRLRDRLHHIKREFLEVEFPPPYPVRLRFERMPKAESYRGRPYHGIYYFRHPGAHYGLIRINRTLRRSEAVYTLLHEWAHVVTEPLPELDALFADEHPDEFYLMLGRIERAYEAWDT